MSRNQRSSCFQLAKFRAHHISFGNPKKNKKRKPAKGGSKVDFANACESLARIAPGVRRWTHLSGLMCAMMAGSLHRPGKLRRRECRGLLASISDRARVNSSGQGVIGVLVVGVVAVNSIPSSPRASGPVLVGTQWCCG
jgi:hypothetical protein